MLNENTEYMNKRKDNQNENNVSFFLSASVGAFGEEIRKI